MIFFYLGCALWGAAIVAVVLGASPGWIIAAQLVTGAVIIGIGVKELRP